MTDREKNQKEGKITETEAKELILQIMGEVSVLQEEITKKAKEEGTWKMGLDANRELFKESDDAAKAKIAEIISRIER